MSNYDYYVILPATNISNETLNKIEEDLSKDKSLTIMMDRGHVSIHNSPINCQRHAVLSCYKSGADNKEYCYMEIAEWYYLKRRGCLIQFLKINVFEEFPIVLLTTNNHYYKPRAEWTDDEHNNALTEYFKKFGIDKVYPAANIESFMEILKNIV